MKIAIVDDEKIELRAAETYLRRYIHENWLEYESDIQIETFSCAADLLKIFRPGVYQLLILDICMDDIDGIQTAQIVRARGDRDCNIVFLTSSDDYVLNGYRVFAVGYFMKPITNHAEEFAKTFEHIFPKLCRKDPELVLRVDSDEVAVAYRNIIYVDIEEHHKVCVHIVGKKKISALNNYAEIQEKICADERFLECYHRIIVNMDYIKAMEPDDFVMLDGTRLPISQRKKKEVKVKFMRYFARR